jgi:hypothetical protein
MLGTSCQHRNANALLLAVRYMTYADSLKSRLIDRHEKAEQIWWMQMLERGMSYP